MRALETHVLNAHAARDRPAAEQEPVQRERRIRAIAAQVVLDQLTRSRRRRRAVFLPPNLLFEMHANAEVSFTRHAEGAVMDAQPGLDAKRVVLTKTSLIAARRTEVRHAAAVRIVRVVGPLA